jgi:hypothetical protein
MRRFTHGVVLAAFIFSCGGQWYAFQCVAWVKMIHDYAQLVPFTEAVSMTFSGKYPCEICKAIAEKQQAETDQICSLDKYDKKFTPPLAIALAPPAASPLRYADYRSFFDSRTEVPPLPPPRPDLV